MLDNLCITIRFLQPYSHGRGDGDEPEWPPSPLRLFQALAAAAAARWNERARLAYAVPALEWLERQPAPGVVAAPGIPSEVKYRLYVPDNVGDKVAKSWRGGNPNASIADYRTEKDVRPTHLNGEAVHYFYPIADGEFEKHRETLIAAARSVTHLGWGIDMVAGDAAVIGDDEAAKLAGERWRAEPGSGGTPLRVPKTGTLKNLMEKHEAFLNRLSDDGFKPVPPLRAFDVVSYRRDTDPVPRPWVAFRILSADPDDDRNPSFDTARKTKDVAAWVRCATGKVCKDWDDVASFVHGHDAADNAKQLKGEEADKRFMYLPLPTINHALNRVECIRRVMIAAPPGCQKQIDWIRRRLPGEELSRDGEAFGMLGILPASDWVVRQYTRESRVWSTVTPVMLPGFDDPGGIRRRLRNREPDKAMSADEKSRRVDELHGRVHTLLMKAFEHAGFTPAAIAGLDWRDVGFRAGVGLARN